MRHSHETQVNKPALRDVAGVLASIRSPEAVEELLTELLTPTELHDFSLRWKLLQLLAAGVPQRKIAHDLSISLCKITRGSRILKQRDSVSAAALKHPTASKPQEETIPCK